MQSIFKETQGQSVHPNMCNYNQSYVVTLPSLSVLRNVILMTITVHFNVLFSFTAVTVFILNTLKLIREKLVT